MKLSSLRPMLWTNQLHESIKFYTEILGFNCTAMNEEWGWAALQRDEVEIMLSVPNAHMAFEKPQFTGSFYFNTDQVDALWNECKDKASICYNIENFEYGMRDFAIYDNNGYILQFGQQIDTLPKS